MKPLLEKQNYYNLILMRDDAGVKTLRLKCAMLKFLIWLLAIICVLAVGGVAGTIIIGKRYLELSEKHKIQEALLAETNLHLERLSSLETLLQVSENANGNSGSKVRNDEVGLQASIEDASGQDADSRADGAAHSETPGTDGEGQNNMSDSANGAATGPADVQRAAFAGSLPLISSEASPIKVENMNIRSQDNRRFRVRYDLHSKAQPNQLSGSVDHAFIMDDGSRVTPQISTADTRFSIQYMKTMENTLRLPDDADADKVKALEIIVVIGQDKYHALFEIP